MAHFLSTENKNYVNKHIEIYSKNKVGQFSKYLETNPMFVTYYSLSDANIRADAGLGNIQEEIGPHSPLRWNKINNFPLYNISELKPELENDDEGIDVEIDLSNVVVLPNTLKPKPTDFFIIDIPSSKPLLFRVNSFNFNTIQSNDFYSLDADLRIVGGDIYSKIAPQVIDEYTCIFENIGTDNKCFVKNIDLDRINSLERCILEVRDMYTSLFYNEKLNLFWQRTDQVTEVYEDIWYYDLYLTRFINESGIFQEDFNVESIILTYDDNIPSNFEFMWRKTLWYAILRRDTTFLEINLYNIPNNITKRFSPIIFHGYECKSVNLMDFHGNLPIGLTRDLRVDIEYYFSNHLITTILNEKGTSENLNYFEKMIFNYLRNIKEEVHMKDIEKEMMSGNKENFKYMPIIIYILLKYHDDYFTKEKTNFLDKKTDEYNMKYELR